MSIFLKYLYDIKPAIITVKKSAIGNANHASGRPMFNLIMKNKGRRNKYSLNPNIM
jgi:hypothetical protein